MPKKLTVMIRDDLDEEFRNAVFKEKGMHKGNLSEAIEEALKMWIAEQSKKEGKTKK
jgi:metal-responsive CopG/Arc/MetJ family transcriptional regulator